MTLESDTLLSSFFTSSFVQLSSNPTLPSSRWTALMIASSAGSLPVVQELLQRGASPSVTNKGGQTPLHYAASKGHVDIGRALLEYGGGGDINARDNAKQCPIHRASSNNKDAFIRMLINPPEPRDGSKREKTRVK